MQAPPTLFWKLSAWLSETVPGYGLFVGVGALVVVVVLVIAAVHYAREQNGRSPFEPM